MKKISYFTIICLFAATFTGCLEDQLPVLPETGDSPVKINEVYSRGSEERTDGGEKYAFDWVELYNTSDLPVDIGGYVLSDQTNRSAKVVIPAGTIIAAYGFFAIDVDVDGGFGLNRNGDMVFMDDADGKLIDQTEFGALAPEQSWARNPDGSDNWQIQTPTPNASNNGVVAQPSITGVAHAPASPTNDDDVTVSATVTAGEGTLTSVKIQWTLDNTAQTDIAMTASGDVYSGTIPKQAINSVIAYSVVAQNSAGGEASVAGNYLVRDAAIVVDYTTLVINEVNGVDKWFEIYNTGSVAINLAGVTAHYSNSEPVSWNSTNTWTGSSDDEIPAGGFFSTTGTLGTGLSANNANVRLQLRAPDGTPLDTYEKLTNVNTGQGYDNLTNKSHVRVPDGTGVWYYTADGVGTKGTTNGISTAGYIKIGEEDGTGSEPDYTKLIVNEISGEHKYVEIYNSGTATIPLDGVKLQRNGGLSEWVGTATDEIPAGAHRIFLFNDYTPTATAPYTGTSTLVDKTTGLETYAQYAGWNVGSGISDQQILKIAVVDPDGVEVSVFIRGDEPLPAWGTSGAARVRTHSYSLISDGTWGYAVPTPGAENGAKVSEIINPGYLTAQP